MTGGNATEADNTHDGADCIVEVGTSNCLRDVDSLAVDDVWVDGRRIVASVELRGVHLVCQELWDGLYDGGLIDQVEVRPFEVVQ